MASIAVCRGESGDTLPYAVDREIDGIEVLIDRAGGSAFLYGHSSGGPLAMRAAIRLGSKVSKRVAMYEPPYNNDPGRRSPGASTSGSSEKPWPKAAGATRWPCSCVLSARPPSRSRGCGGHRSGRAWKPWRQRWPTTTQPSSGEPWSVPTELAARVSVPAVVMAGDTSLPFMPDAARVLSQAIPQGQLRMLAGQTHEVNPGVLAPVLVEFFTS